MPEASPALVPPSGGQRRVVAGIVVLEAAVLVVAAGFLAVGAITSPDAAARPGAIFLIMLAVAIAVALCFSAVGVIGGERWTRGPILTWQLLQAGVSMPVISTGTWWLGLPLLAIALVAAALMIGRRVIPRD